MQGSLPGRSASIVAATPGFAHSLNAVGSGVLYLSLWAGFSSTISFLRVWAFAAMILVTAFNGFLAWVQDAELLAVYAIVGALSTPLLISSGGNHQVTLFSYLLVLDVAVLVLVVLRPWSRLLFGAFVGTVAFFAGLVVCVLFRRSVSPHLLVPRMLLSDLCFHAAPYPGWC